MQIKDWIKENNLNVKFLKPNVFEIENVGKFLVASEQEFTFDERLILNLTDEEIDLIEEVDYIAFKFGSFWFYQGRDDEDFKLNFLRNLGNSSFGAFKIPFLGVHGKYELCNGSRDYVDWIKKAKFLGYSSLGICEQQTLGGTYNFQKACDKEGIKAIIGRTSVVKSFSGSLYNVKVFAKNKAGWDKLLKVHAIECITRESSGKYITEQELVDLSNDLFLIICHETDLDLVDKEVMKNAYFQFNPVRYKFDNKDEEHLLNLKKYLNNYLDVFKPIIIQDAFYLEKGDHIIKPILNKVINKTFQFYSEDEYFKHFDEIIANVLPLFNETDARVDKLISDSIDNLLFIESECTFQVKREGRHLPKYKMNTEEAALYSSNDEMFIALIQKGYEEKVLGKVENEDIYLERLEKEIAVLQEGDVIDYFLIVYDVYNFLRSNCGIGSLGRGSAAGALVSYLLGIVQIDPIKYNLLFERFLSKARLLGGSLPDIDCDIPSFFRQNVIDYMIEKYGQEQVACIGTAQNFKLKSSLKDLLKKKGVDFSTSNFITSLFTKEYDHASIEGIFKLASTEPKIKEIVKQFPEIVYEIYLCIFQARSFGIHAAGVIIAPEYNAAGERTTIHDYAPCRFSDGQYVTEWEKDAVEEIGLLKEDILGLAQLDKIIRMNELIKQNGKEFLPFEKIDFQDPKILKLFKTASTEDIFQFNTDIQKNYLLQLQPDSVHDLIAANALNRPGAMENNSHNKFIKIKNGEEQAYYPPLLENILSSTYGLFAYQEQAMLAFQIATECSLEESDNFRKVITKLKPGKKNPDIEKYEEIFHKAYLEKIGDEEIVKKVWAMIIGFATYGFNLSHAASYALTGYWAAYYKAYFPVEFYTTSLEMAKDEALARVINEIQSQQLVNLSHPDINKSTTQYGIDYDTNSIYWSLSSIKFAGEKAVSTLLEDRNTNGSYFSFEEFLERAKNFKVNKRIITNFILCGCFDELEKITEEKERMGLLEQYYAFLNEDIPEEIKYHKDNNKNHFWILYQKQLCGLGDINFEHIYKSQKLQYWLAESYIDPYLFNDETSRGRTVVIGGLLEVLKEKVTKKGDTMAFLQINSNSQIINITCWGETYSKFKAELSKSMFQPILISGTIVKDFRKPINVLQTNQFTKIVKS